MPPRPADNLALSPLRAAPRPLRTRVMVQAATTTIAGLVLGIGTQILQGVLPDSWGVLANSGVVWAIGAFALGAILPGVRSAAIGGAVELVVASCVFYLAVDWFEGSSSNPRGAIIWSCVGVVAGGVFGTAGHLARRSTQHHCLAWATLGGAIAGEGTYLTWQVGTAATRPAGLVELAVAATLLAACMIRADRRIITGVAFIAAAVSTSTADHLINIIFTNT